MRRLAALLAAFAACHRGAPQTPDDTGDDAAIDDSAAADDGGLLGDGTANSGCADGSQLVYVVSEERNLYSFDPQKALFHLIAHVDCAGTFANSMAVDRGANAWINYADGSLWQVSTKTGACTPTSFVPNQEGVGLFGMGFMSKYIGGSEETLFICDLNGGGLGTIDLGTMKLARMGKFAGSLANRDCELTGTGDAHLYGFFVGSPLGDAGPASVDDINLATEGALKEWILSTVDTGSDWAFSFWGGDFYLYTADKYDANDPFTTVTRFRPSDGSVTVLARNIGFRVVGAGVSTCAPTAPPK